MSSVTFVIIVGSIKKPFLVVIACPPTTTLAPLLFASAICAFTFSTALSLINGPTCVPSSNPFPTVNSAAFAANFSTKASAMDSCTYTRFVQMHV